MIRRSIGQLEYEECPELVEQGVEHGFLTGGLDFAAASSENSSGAFRAAFAVESLFQLEQVHGPEIVEVGDIGKLSPRLKADGWFIPRRIGGHAGRIAFGIRTADCLPIIIASDSHIALLHAGWRGVCAGIERRAVSLFSPYSPVDALVVALGPCAGAAAYEVGPEVLEKFGGQAVFEIRQGRSYLDIRGTVVQSLKRAGVKSQLVKVSSECTIFNSEFHSYRRDGASSGRNLTFVIV